jgi:hypothetical protein
MDNRFLATARIVRLGEPVGAVVPLTNGTQWQGFSHIGSARGFAIERGIFGIWHRKTDEAAA